MLKARKVSFFIVHFLPTAKCKNATACKRGPENIRGVQPRTAEEGIFHSGGGDIFTAGWKIFTAGEGHFTAGRFFDAGGHFTAGEEGYFHGVGRGCRELVFARALAKEAIQK